MHKALIDADNDGAENIAVKYVQECQIMANLRHPNVAQFLGVCFLENCLLPVLLMEKLDDCLDNLLETVPNIPLALKRSILEDVARGLLYLHLQNPQIIHRDLTAKNVLLTSRLVAKITDFGNSRIVNLQPAQLARTLSRLPGTLVYMPPEAFEASSRYGPSLDIFSFGHLALFVALQVISSLHKNININNMIYSIPQLFPGNLLQHNYPDPADPDQLVARSEVSRRERYFEQLENLLLATGPVKQVLIQLVKDCLHNIPSQRPTSEQLVTALEEIKADVEGDYGELATVDAVRQVKTMKALKAKSNDKVNELAAKDKEIQQLQQQLEVKLNFG